MTEIDSFFKWLNDIQYRVWKLKSDTERCNMDYVTRSKVTAKLQESWNILNDVKLIVFRYEKEKKNDE